MMLDLSDQETEALAGLLRRTIDDDRYPLSPRVQTLKAILAKLRPEPARGVEDTGGDQLVGFAPLKA